MSSFFAYLQPNTWALFAGLCIAWGLLVWCLRAIIDFDLQPDGIILRFALKTNFFFIFIYYFVNELTPRLGISARVSARSWHREDNS
jgi:hypothetical protein